MKIALLAHSHYPIAEPFSGGLESFTHGLTRSLIRKGHDVTLFAADGSDEALNYQPFCTPTAEEIFRPTEDIVRYRERAYINVLDDIAKGGFDLVHNNSLHYVPLHLANTLPCPMITTLHTPPFVPMINGFRNARLYDNHYTVAVSDNTGKQWQRQLSHLNYNVIHNGVDTDIWRPVSEKCGDYALWSGRITPEKGTHLAIEAAVKAGIKLRICGPIFDEMYYIQQVLPLLQNHSDTVHYLGNLSMTQLRLHLAHATMLVCTPCWDEPFGLVVAESLACGTPVCGFANGALPEILNEECARLSVQDSDVLAEAMMQMHDISPRYCRLYALKHFSLDAMVGQYEQAYADILNNAQQTQRHYG